MRCRRPWLVTGGCLAAVAAREPTAEPSLPAPLDTAALAADAAGETALAALSFIRFASLVGVFIEGADDLHDGPSAANAAARHAEHAVEVLAGCPGAGVEHEERSGDVI